MYIIYNNVKFEIKIKFIRELIKIIFYDGYKSEFTPIIISPPPLPQGMHDIFPTYYKAANLFNKVVLKIAENFLAIIKICW